MKQKMTSKTAKLINIPGVGKSIAADLESLGYKKPADLQGQDPEEMYNRLMTLVGSHVDRCVLYVFRCAVYYVSTTNPTADKLLWWNWKDKID
jgi:hypothetical protein